MHSQNFDSTNFGIPAPDFWSFNQYLFPSQPLVADPPNGRVHQPPNHHYWIPPQPGHALNLLVDPPAATRFEPVPRTVSNVNGLNGYAQPLNTNHFRPVVTQRVEPAYAGFLSQDPPFPGQTMVSGIPASVSVPGRVAFAYPENTTGGSTDACVWDVQNTYKFGLNAEAGPSTLPSPRTQDIGSTTLQPSGRVPETTADAENIQFIAENGVVPVKRTRLANGHRGSRDGRKRQQVDAKELAVRVKVWKGFEEPPTQNDAIAFILELLPTFRAAVYQEPQLLEGQTRQFPGATRHAELERRRRGEERALFEELSRYYKLPLRQRKWRRPELLKKVLKDLDDHPHLVTPPIKPAVSANT